MESFYDVCTYTASECEYVALQSLSMTENETLKHPERLSKFRHQTEKG